MRVHLHLWLIPLLPLAGAAINGLLGRRFPKRMVAWVGNVFVGTSCAVAWHVFARFLSLPHEMLPYVRDYATWIRAGAFSVSYGVYLDQLSMIMVLVVTSVGFLIHIYSIGYMAHEGGYYRFFAYLNLFMFFMLTLVL